MVEPVLNTFEFLAVVCVGFPLLLAVYCWIEEKLQKSGKNSDFEQ